MDKDDYILGFSRCSASLKFLPLLVIIGFRLQRYRQLPFQTNLLPTYFDTEEGHDSLIVVETPVRISKILQAAGVGELFPQGGQAGQTAEVLERFPAEVKEEICVSAHPSNGELNKTLVDLRAKYRDLSGEDTFLFSCRALRFIIDEMGLTGNAIVPRSVPVFMATVGLTLPLFHHFTLLALRIDGDCTSMTGLQKANETMSSGHMNVGADQPTVDGYLDDAVVGAGVNGGENDQATTLQGHAKSVVVDADFVETVLEEQEEAGVKGDAVVDTGVAAGDNGQAKVDCEEEEGIAVHGVVADGAEHLALTANGDEGYDVIDFEDEAQVDQGGLEISTEWVEISEIFSAVGCDDTSDIQALDDSGGGE